jgi:hypothetical protein
MYTREFLRGSSSLLALSFASFLVDSSQAVISHVWATLLAALVSGAWVLFFWHFFRSTSMSRREKAAAWLTVGILFCAAMLLRSDYVDGLSWRVTLSWYAFWLSLLFVLVVVVRSVAPPIRFPETHFTVQSEAPDHVARVDGA